MLPYLNEAGGAFLSRQREVEVYVGGRRRLAGRSLRLLPLAVAVAVLLLLLLLGRSLRTCGETEGGDIR